MTNLDQKFKMGVFRNKYIACNEGDRKSWVMPGSPWEGQTV